MAYDQALADRVRDGLAERADVTERKIMGVLCFVTDGHMCCGVTGGALMVRVGPRRDEQVLTEPHVAPMRVGGRLAKGYVLVEQAALPGDAALLAWIERGVDFVSTLPPKVKALIPPG